MDQSIIDQMLTRLTRLEDQQAVLRMFYAYSHAIDYHERDTFAACFMLDAVWDVHTRHGGSCGRYTDELARDGGEWRI